jgi:hypothetical protein
MNVNMLHIADNIGYIYPLVIYSVLQCLKMKYTGVTFFQTKIQYHFIFIVLDEIQVMHLKSRTNDAAVLFV